MLTPPPDDPSLPAQIAEQRWRIWRQGNRGIQTWLLGFSLTWLSKPLGGSLGTFVLVVGTAAVLVGSAMVLAWGPNSRRLEKLIAELKKREGR